MGHGAWGKISDCELRIANLKILESTNDYWILTTDYLP
jgi:hypothetical protein